MHLFTTLATEESSGGGGAAVAQLGILLLIPLAMYFLMIRPQRKRMREQAAMQTALQVGDEIVTTSGMFGFITGFDEDRVWVEIDEDVQVRLAKAAIQGKVDTSSTDDRPDTADADADTAPGGIAATATDTAVNASSNSNSNANSNKVAGGKRPKGARGGTASDVASSADASSGAARDDTE